MSLDHGDGWGSPLPGCSETRTGPAGSLSAWQLLVRARVSRPPAGGNCWWCGWCCNKSGAPAASLWGVSPVKSWCSSRSLPGIQQWIVRGRFSMVIIATGQICTWDIINIRVLFFSKKKNMSNSRKQGIVAHFPRHPLSNPLTNRRTI